MSTAPAPARPPSRRGLVRGVAWAAPTAMLAVAAPAYAVSCDPRSYVVDIGSANYTRTSRTAATATTIRIPGALPVTVTISVAPNRASPADDNLTVHSGNVGGTGQSGVLLHQTGGNSGGQTVTFTFSRAVTGLAFTIADIDREVTGQQAFDDRISVSNGYAIASQGSNINTTYPFRSRGGTGQSAPTDSSNSIRLTYSGARTSVSVTVNEQYGLRDQDIYIAGMTFTAPGCA